MKRYSDPLFSTKKKKHPALVLFFALLFLFLTVALALNHVNNSRVELLNEKVTVPNLPSALENFRILHISDFDGLTFGENQERLIHTIGDAKYDIVCITGDVTGKDGDYGPFIQLLSHFQELNKPVYFIPGDEDPNPLIAIPHGNNSAKADYILAAEAMGAVYLDAPERITRGKGVLWIYPEWAYTMDIDASAAIMNTRMAELQKQPDSPERNAAITAVAYQIDQMERIRAARRVTLESDIHVALTHHPLQLSALEDMLAFTSAENDSYVRSISLILAGHYVSGQWHLPILGALRVPPSSGLGMNGWFPDDEKVVGLASFLGIPQYISPGLGTSDLNGLPSFRFMNTPAVTILTLTSKLIH